MSDVVACPSCGRELRLPEGLASLLVQCRGCGLLFQATAARARPPERAAPPEPCPYCGLLVPATAARCRHCGRGLVDAWEGYPRLRRDCEPHRSGLVGFLGTVSLITGILALCSFGLGSLVSLPTGLTAWLMANHDLRLMRDGAMDRAGWTGTRLGRQNAVTGVVVSGVCVAGYALLYALMWARW